MCKIKTYFKINRAIFFLIFLFLLTGCTAPDRKQVSQDFRELFLINVGKGAHPIIISINSGEGDSDNVYEYVNFAVIADEDMVLKSGWLAGISLRKGQTLYGCEVVMLYQNLGGRRWKMTWSDFKFKPSK